MENNLVVRKGKPGKICRSCLKFRTMREFETNRMRWCKRCQLKHRLMGLISPERDLLRPVAVPHAPPLSRDEHNARRRAHRRAKQAADEAIQPKQARKRPVAQADYRLCMRCRRRKLYSEFGSWRIRVCLACDGPTLEEIIMNPQRVRSIPEDC